MKKFISFLLSVVLIISICPTGIFEFTAIAETDSGTCGNNLTWQYNTETYTLTISGTGDMNNYSYTTTAPWQQLRTSIKTVVINSGVTRVGNHAFYYCTGLTSITIPDGVTSIGDSAFSACFGLTSITIPDGVTSIGSKAFYHCTGLTNITIPDSVTSIGVQAFSDCFGLTSITIPDSVKKIEGYAFSACFGLTSITIPSSVTSIGDYAFRGCTGLESITVESGNTGYHSAGNCLIETESKNLILGCVNSVIPDDGSVTSIGNAAFRGCTGLTSITIPDGVTSIGEQAFYGCTGLESITVESGNTGYHSAGNCLIETESKNLILGCVNSVIPDDGSVTSIGNAAFRGCTGLTSITIPDSVTSIGEEAFSYCTGLTSITIPNSVTSIGGYAFSGCTKLTSITIPDGVTSIGDYAFNNTAWYNNQPDGLVYAGKVAYRYKGTCPASVTIKYGTLGIVDSAFSGCTGLTSITIPDSVKSIGDSAFSGCTGLTSITIPDSVTSISGSAFSGCTGLKSITIPDSVKKIGNNAFDNTAWYNNQSDGLVYAGKVAYKYKGAYPESVTIKEGTLVIADYAFHGYTGLTSITIPDSVTSIGDYAFEYCIGLKDVYYKGSEEQKDAIETGNSNDRLLNAEWHYNYVSDTPDVGHTAHIPGDINGDGIVNNKDLLRLLKHLSGWNVTINQKALDINNDGNVNNKDLIRLLKHISGWDVKIF